MGDFSIAMMPVFVIQGIHEGKKKYFVVEGKTKKSDFLSCSYFKTLEDINYEKETLLAFDSEYSAEAFIRFLDTNRKYFLETYAVRISSLKASWVRPKGRIEYRNGNLKRTGPRGFERM